MNPTSLMFNQMKGISNGAVAEFAAGAGSSSRLSANMQDDQNSLLDVVSQNTPDSGLAKIRDDEVDSNKSGSENNGTLGSAEISQDSRKRKKRYNRHTQHQIQEMEAFFRECPHPDDKQRKELARELGLEPLQVKFWFQNKRTQVKNQHERSENSILRNDNEKLRAENIRYKEALSAASCPACGGQVSLGEISFDEHNLRLENARLRDEINRMSALAVKYVGKPVISAYSPPHHQMPMPCLDLGVGGMGMQEGEMEMYGAAGGDILRTLAGISDIDKPVIIELAVSAMEELLRIAHIESPLWIPAPDNVTETLNLEEYFRAFPKGVERRAEEGIRTEASRENAVVPINHFHLVEILMDVNQWSKVFCPIVSRASTVEVLSTGIAGSFNGALQVMTAEFQVPSPLVSTRESLFVRYCKQQDNGTWVVADISLDHHLNPSSSRFRRYPSGCLIQEMPDGFSKVTWVEHVEVDETSIYNIYKETIKCGLAFGAKRWIATLNRQCERLASAMTTQLLPGDVIGVVPSLEGRKAMLKLSERMVTNFGFNVGASTAHSWTTLCGSGNEDIRIMSRKNINDPGRPSGVVLSAVISFWLPTPPKRTFDFLRSENSRNEWDILSNGGFVQEIAHIANGQDHGNCVSLLRISGPNNSQGNMLILQECCVDDSGCLVVYSPIDVVSMNTVLNGEEDPDFVSLLPSGFAVLPDGPNVTTPEDGISSMGCGGSLLTVSFQILVSSAPTAKVDIRSVTTISNIINSTVNRIRAALSCSQS